MGFNSGFKGLNSFMLQFAHALACQVKVLRTNNIVKTDTTLTNLVSIDNDSNNNNNNNSVFCDVTHDFTKAFFTFSVSYSFTGYV